MNHLSLFSGMGGFDLAAEWIGWNNVAHCEWNPFCQQILKYYWPKAISYEDITKTDFSIHRGNIDIVTGGFPCQPYSLAGQRKGKDDERHLWPHMLRAIREIKPRWVVGENVLGLVGWNGGLVFEEVQADLEAEGYEVQPYILPGSSVNAPHRRDRVWFVAYSTAERCKRGSSCDWSQENQAEWANFQHMFAGPGEEWNATDPTHIGLERFGNAREIEREGAKRDEFTRRFHNIQDWLHFPTQSPICVRNDGISSRLDGITFPKWRNESIKAGGNAIVPQVALQIFKAIKQYSISNT